MSEIFRAIGFSAAIVFLLLTGITTITATMVRRAEASEGKEFRVAVPNDGLKQTITRRSWFSWLALAWVSFVASVATGGAATGRFLFPNVLFEPPSTFKAGFPRDVLPGEVDRKFKQEYGVWLVRDTDPVTGKKGIAALSDICTHLGCIPNWLEDEQKFKCPCHGSGYYKNGINFEGPTPRPLERFAISLADDGQILVDKNRKFQYEKGQWANPDSFLQLS